MWKGRGVILEAVLLHVRQSFCRRPRHLLISKGDWSLWSWKGEGRYWKLHGCSLSAWRPGSFIVSSFLTTEWNFLFLKIWIKDQNRSEIIYLFLIRVLYFPNPLASILCRGWVTTPALLGQDIASERVPGERKLRLLTEGPTVQTYIGQYKMLAGFLVLGLVTNVCYGYYSGTNGKTAE